jgi:hypothetical protein
VTIHVTLENNNTALITKRGQLVTSPLEFSKPYSAEANTINTAFNLVPPIAGKQFVITSILLSGNRSIGASDATVSLYEASSDTETTVLIDILPIEIAKNQALTFTGVNVIVAAGSFINLKTDDATVFAVVYGYYVNEVT